MIENYFDEVEMCEVIVLRFENIVIVISKCIMGDEEIKINIF